MTVLTIRATHDDDAHVWWAESDDVPGLVSEAKTFEALVNRVMAVVPDLLVLNQQFSKGVTVNFVTMRHLQDA